MKTTRKTLLMLLLTSLTCALHAQEWQWAHDFTGLWDLFDAPREIRTDDSGNIYIMSRQADTINIAGVEIPMDPMANESRFTFMKFDSNGEYIWHRSFARTVPELLWMDDFVVTNEGIIYAVGYYGSFTFDPYELDGIELEFDGFRDAAIFEIGVDGLVNSVVTISETAPLANEGNYVAALNPDQSSLIVAGPHVGTQISIGDETFDLEYDIQGATTGLFAFNYNLENEEVAWIESGFGSAADDFIEEVRVNESDEVFLSGMFSGETIQADDFSATNPNPQGFLNADNFYLKIDENGEPVWLNRTGTDELDQFNRIELAPDGGLYAIGNLYTDATIEGVQMTAPGTFFVHYNFEGASSEVMKVSNGTLGAVALKENGNLLMAGGFGDESLEIGEFSLSNNGGALGTSDMYLAEMNPNAEIVNAWTYGGMEDETIDHMRYLPGSGSIIAFGEFASLSLELDDVTLENDEFPFYENFVGSLNISLSADFESPIEYLSVYPNPATDQVSFHLENVPVGLADFLIRDVQGRIVRQERRQLNGLNQLDISRLESGIYFLDIRAEGSHYASKLIVE